MNSKRLKLLAGFFLVFFLSAATQAASYYRTNDSTGVVWNWSDAAKWQVSPDGSTDWATATEAPNAENSAGIEILGGTNVLVDISDSSGQAAVASGGTVKIDEGATITANGETGGEINLLAKGIVMTAANINADGNSGGGIVRIGGGWQGQDGYLCSDSTYINHAGGHRTDFRRLLPVHFGADGTVCRRGGF